VSRPNPQLVMAIALLADRTQADFGSSPEEATRMLLRRIFAVMVDAGRPMLTVQEMTRVLDQLSSHGLKGDLRCEAPATLT
jgi:hypothetical protein